MAKIKPMQTILILHYRNIRTSHRPTQKKHGSRREKFSYYITSHMFNLQLMLFEHVLIQYPCLQLVQNRRQTRTVRVVVTRPCVRTGSVSEGNTGVMERRIVPTAPMNRQTAVCIILCLPLYKIILFIRFYIGSTKFRPLMPFTDRKCINIQT